MMAISENHAGLLFIYNLLAYSELHSNKLPQIFDSTNSTKSTILKRTHLGLRRTN